MKYAARVSEVLNAFSPYPLKKEQMAEFYCSDTMESRMSDKVDSPMKDIFEICQGAGDENAFLLLGHRGCGKSTELNRLSEKLISDGYPVKTVLCNVDLDLVRMVHTDLLILMGDALLQMAEDLGCEPDEKFLEEMGNLLYEGTEILTSQESGGVSGEMGVSAETPGIFTRILKIFATVKMDLKYNEETRREYRRKISVRSSEWIRALSRIAEEIAGKTGGKSPILIFEDLDKLNPENAWEVFYNYAAVLSGMPFPVIYTFPIALAYDPRFAAMESYFITKTLPMIKIETIKGELYTEGIGVIREIVAKRADLKLFEDGVLEELIQCTGGSLRDLFAAINSSAKRATRRGGETIEKEDANRALEEIKTTLTRRIEQRDYNFLLNICRGNKEQIEDKEMLLKMLQASVVLEYNGKRWHNVHPLVVKFFKEQGIIADDGE